MRFWGFGVPIADVRDVLMSSESREPEALPEEPGGGGSGVELELSEDSALTGDEEHLARLRGRIASLTEEARTISRVLPRAVSMTAQGGGLAEAMTPAVERSLELSGKRDPAPLAQALFPVIGAAIRRAMADSVKRAFLTLNRAMLSNFSVQGWRLRAQARRTGKPFYAVLAEHTRSLPVRQVFLIHRETGLLLGQAQSEVDTSKDWDIVSGMLTALTDFIHDSFSIGQEDSLETIRVGELTVMIEQGRHAALAGIVHGEIPDDLRDRFRAALDKIHEQLGPELQVFDGDTAIVESRRAFLDTALGALVGSSRVRILPQTWLVAVVPLLVLLVWGYFVVVEELRWNRYVADVAARPGIVVIDEGQQDGRRFIHGLRDPMAVDPVQVLGERGFFVGDVDSRWAPYQALHSTLTLPRIRQVLDPPPGIELSLEDGMLVMRGSASQEWIDRAIETLKSMTGMTGYMTDNLVVSDIGETRYWNRYLARLEREPGIVVIQSGRRNGGFSITGLRDPMAADPEALLREAGLAPDRVNSRWEPYQALHPTLILTRARQVLQPPAGVRLSMQGTELAASGRASHAWIAQARSLARAIAGVTAFREDELIDDDLQQVETLKREIESQFFRFLVGSPDLWPGQGSRMESLIAKIEELKTGAARCGRDVTIEIRGHTDASGDPQRDQLVSESLAQSFYENLRWRGLDMAAFEMQGMGSVQPPQLDISARESLNRLVSFKVILSDG